MSFSRKPASAFSAIIRFIGWAMVLFALCISLWMYFYPSYQAVVLKLSNVELGILGLRSFTEVRPVQKGETLWIGVFHQRYYSMQTYLFCFDREELRTQVPMFLALMFATPIGIARRIKLALWGIVIITAAASLAVLLNLYWAYAFLPENNPFNPFNPSSSGLTISDFFYNAYTLIGIHLLPIALWLALFFRRGESFQLVTRHVEKIAHHSAR